MKSGSVLFFLMICLVPYLAHAQVSLTEVIDPLLDGRDINGVSTNSNGETIIFDDNHIFTFVNDVTDDFICELCYDIQAVTSRQDTQYIANGFGGIIKRFDDSLQIVADYDASSLEIDKNGILYGNDYGNGFFQWNGSSWQHWNEDNSNLPSDYVYDLAIDSNGLVWLATHAGLVSFNGSSFSIKSVPNELSETFYDIAIDENNAVWVGSAYGGLGRYANNTWTTFPQTFTILQLVQNVGILHGNEVWTASFEKGLYRYLNNQFIKYSPLFFGFSDFGNCAFLFGDPQGRLWMQFDFMPLMYLTTEPTSIRAVESKSIALSISPNPTDGIVYFSIPSDQPGLTHIQLFTAEGTLCQNQNIPILHQISLDMSHLASGLYVALLTDSNGHRAAQKIILR